MDDPSITVRVEQVGIQINDAWLLDGVSFACRQGEWTLLDGPSGAGKSTLLRAINGLRVPTRGRIWTLGSEIPGRTRLRAKEVWRQTGTVLQEIALFETKTATHNVELALRCAGVDRAATRARAVDWLTRMRLEDKLDEYPCNLSGGQCQRIALARALAVQPRLLILDEPTSALDREVASVFFEAVKQLVGQGTTVVMSSHRADEVVELCHQRISLQKGRIDNIEHRPVLASKPDHATEVGEGRRDEMATQAITRMPRA
jgi:polar amino acid transport system ATP-binding protein